RKGTIKLGPLAAEFLSRGGEPPADGQQHGIIFALQGPREGRERLDGALTVEQRLVDASAHPIQCPRRQGTARDRRQYNQTAAQQKSGMQALDRHHYTFCTIICMPYASP